MVLYVYIRSCSSLALKYYMSVLKVLHLRAFSLQLALLYLSELSPIWGGGDVDVY